ncbi:TRAP-type C4-dicarboxylate transport system, small permease component [Tistlia consotensis]|uniref:TRAP transporter small permease protein n=1 Tax=Tistlia consotensis USBA 355 TaxID=560819 RepID=A0A1Y6BF54_9PROT|nr:TRAP transporter small permease subunit [Tistlia consotensis]SMF06937.1 TRAP-type C4-dicarboxylate transport system, small permease component [Tistlia consotensis USBA 355]SNR36199.1 TRAP-type C4-dicarboxylate transport system, small permease component [Tistlia consotensis]
MAAVAAARAAFLAVERRVTQAAVAAGCLGLAVAALTGLYQVLARFVLLRPASWSEPLIQVVLIWMAYLALAGAMRSGSLIAVDLLLRVATGRARRALRTLVTLAVLALLATLFWFGCLIVWRVRFQTIAGLDVAASWAYAALPFGSALSILALLAHAADPPVEAAPEPDAAG